MMAKTQKEGCMEQSYRDAVVISSDPTEMLDLPVAAGARSRRP